MNNTYNTRTCFASRGRGNLLFMQRGPQIKNVGTHCLIVSICSGFCGLAMNLHSPVLPTAGNIAGSIVHTISWSANILTRQRWLHFMNNDFALNLGVVKNIKLDTVTILMTDTQITETYYYICLVRTKVAPIRTMNVKRPLWRQRNMFGTWIKIMWGEQLVDPSVYYIIPEFISLTVVIS